jgi:hypothetical protein
MGAKMVWMGRQALIVTFFQLLLFSSNALPADTPVPTSVTIVGSLQSELGCLDDWQPDCAATHLAFDPADNVWQGTFNVPAGNFEYKTALNDSWDENYGQNATSNGANIPLDLSEAKAVKFYYSHETHWVTSNQNSVIAVAAGSFQSELGCPGDWQPDCLRSWLQDPDGDGIYTFTTQGLPAGSYEVKVAIKESWDENYGAGGVQNGANIPFTVPQACGDILFSYNAATHVLTVSTSTGADLQGPVTSNVYANPNPVPYNFTGSILLTAHINDSTTGNSNISAGEYSVNSGPWLAMAPSTGFDTPSETVTASFLLAEAGIATSGVYNICVRGTDALNNVGNPECILLVVYDPTGGFVSGEGWIYSPLGAYLSNPTLEGKAKFGFVSKYKKGAIMPGGTTEFSFQAGNFYFYSANYEWLVVNQAGTYAQFKGIGAINGQVNYKFMLWAGDGLPDTFRIKIWTEDGAGNENVVYDNGFNQPIDGGSIIIHKK